MKEVHIDKDITQFRSIQLTEHTGEKPTSHFYLGVHSSEKGEGGLDAVK